ncbi:ROK family transcriptional regulator [Microbacterium oryzae]|uniref:ROK family protein n=1 Tax=Microbacterium oryzae TaxID=743009 RepID=A0A6I6E1F0_9MICO|nr:ROK family protein [Microbacterium oryzae]QGU26370.1 ROK family protein [Microbacterium oryzae]
MAERTASVEGVRRRNLGEVLRLVHEQGPQPRARITADTGLNRSTVADLVAALADAGLVAEREPDPTRRVGRPSPIVVPSDDVVVIAANPEVDALEVAAIALSGAVRARVREECRELLTPEQTADALARIVSGWRERDLKDARLVGAGLAVPGLVSLDGGVVRLAPHLHWEEAPVAAIVEARLDLPVVIGNDATLGARAEHLFGAAAGHRDVVYLNGGASGIGGGLIVDGRVVGGAGGYAGEWGRTRPGLLDDADRRTPEGALEDEVSRARLLAVLGLDAADDPTLADALAASGHPEVHAEVERQRRILATALANAVNVLNPSAIVLGGFLGMLVAADPAGFDAAVRGQALAPAAEELVVRAAGLAEDRLLIGAAEAAFAPLLADPLG